MQLDGCETTPKPAPASPVFPVSPTMLTRFVGLVFVVGTAYLVAEEPVGKPLPWKPVSLDARDTSVTQLLKSLREQTGVAVHDEIGEPRVLPHLKLDAVPFWEAADTIARRARAKLVAS